MNKSTRVQEYKSARVRRLLYSFTFVLFLCTLPFLYGQTVTLPGMTEATSVAPNDLLWLWLDPAGANVSRKIKAVNLLKRARSCEIIIGNPNASAVLADGDDSPVTCGNVSGADATITAVACYADAATGGTPSVNPILSGGTATSILSAPLSCGNAAWTAGTVTGAPSTPPVIHSFATNGATCSVPPCSLNTNINQAGGVAKYVIVRFTIVN